MTSLSDLWMQTYTGRQFFPYAPKADDVCIEDIAHHLALTCRYNGACEWHYSVAQHSVYVSQFLEREGYDMEWQLIGLLHDAAEAYCNDLVRPVKKGLDEYERLEWGIQRAIGEKFGLNPLSFSGAILHHADYAVGEAEKEQIMKAPPAPWEPYHTRADIHITEMAWQHAEMQFLARYRLLEAQR